MGGRSAALAIPSSAVGRPAGAGSRHVSIIPPRTAWG